MRLFQKGRRGIDCLSSRFMQYGNRLSDCILFSENNWLRTMGQNHQDIYFSRQSLVEVYFLCSRWISLSLWTFESTWTVHSLDLIIDYLFFYLFNANNTHTAFKSVTRVLSTLHFFWHKTDKIHYTSDQLFSKATFLFSQVFHTLVIHTRIRTRDFVYSFNGALFATPYFQGSIEGE